MKSFSVLLEFPTTSGKGHETLLEISNNEDFSRASNFIERFFSVHYASMIRFIKISNSIESTENKLFIVN